MIQACLAYIGSGHRSCWNHFWRGQQTTQEHPHPHKAKLLAHPQPPHRWRMVNDQAPRVFAKAPKDGIQVWGACVAAFPVGLHFPS
ncbi:hypothetical protein BJX76DRAFT_315224 [Aspergillus varians]